MVLGVQRGGEIAIDFPPFAPLLEEGIRGPESFETVEIQGISRRKKLDLLRDVSPQPV
jgi:hypothetical protein